MTTETNDRYSEEINKALEVLHKVVDPELFVNIVDLGLVYELNFQEKDKLGVKMTLSTPYCPMGESIIHGVETLLGETFSNREIVVDLVWEPEWSVEMITEEGKKQLGIEQ